MILRSYGDTLHSVDIHFDSKAFNEIGFRRNRKTSIPIPEFEEEWEKVSEHEITAIASGDVQDETQQEMLDRMQARLEELVDELDENEAIRVESGENDWPKARDDQKKVILDGENRLRFNARVDPPLRVAVWRRTD